MKVEEKIARAYHRDLTWRKVLVRLEPDAHNNMVVRRMFSNAYGWPVIKHLVDTHFSDTYVARTDDKDEPSEERAKAIDKGVGKGGEEVKSDLRKPHRTDSELREVGDEVGELKGRKASEFALRPRAYRDDSSWSDHYFEVTDDEDESEMTPDRGRPGSSRQAPSSGQAKGKEAHFREPEDDVPEDAPKGTSETVIADFLSSSPIALKAPELKASSQKSAENSAETSGSATRQEMARGGSLTDVGLRKSPKDSLDPKISNRGRRSSSSSSSHSAQEEGVSRRVARLSVDENH